MCHAQTQPYSTEYQLIQHTQKLHTSTSEAADTPGTAPVPLEGAVNSSTKANHFGPIAEIGKTQTALKNGQQSALSMILQDQAIKIIQSNKTLPKVMDGKNASPVLPTLI